MSLKENFGNGARTVVLGLAGLVGMAGLNSGCTQEAIDSMNRDWVAMNTIQRRPYRTVSDPGNELLPEGITVCYGWVDRNQDGKMQRGELIGEGNHSLKAKEGGLIIGKVVPPYGMAKLCLYDSATGRLVDESPEMNTSASNNLIRAQYGRFRVSEEGTQNPRMTIILVVNGRECGRDSVEVLP